MCTMKETVKRKTDVKDRQRERNRTETNILGKTERKDYVRKKDKGQTEQNRKGELKYVGVSHHNN